LPLVDEGEHPLVAAQARSAIERSVRGIQCSMLAAGQRVESLSSSAWRRLASGAREDHGPFVADATFSFERISTRR